MKPLRLMSALPPRHQVHGVSAGARLMMHDFTAFRRISEFCCRTMMLYQLAPRLSLPLYLHFRQYHSGDRNDEKSRYRREYRMPHVVVDV